MDHGSDGLGLVKRLNSRLREKDRRIAEAGGWITATDPAWRGDWRSRMEDLLADIEAKGVVPPTENFPMTVPRRGWKPPGAWP